MMFDLEPAITLPWLVRLRWAYLAGQLVVFPILHVWFGIRLDLEVIAVEVTLMAGSNVALTVVQRSRRWSRPNVIGAVMVLDTALITLLLAGSGGSANPFTVLYLVHITLSAIVLRVWWTIAIAVLSLVGFGLLFLGPTDHTMHHGGNGFDRHLQAMWAAFAIAAALIAFFVGRVTRAITAQREQIAGLRETSERNERLASVTRLAAGAAHELGSPLSTIAVAAHEAKRHLGARAEGVTIAADLELIVLEVERCQDILHRMAAQGTEGVETPLSLSELADRIRDHLGEGQAHRLELEIVDPARFANVPHDQLVASTVALIKNGLEASGDRRVVVRLAGTTTGIEIAVQDRGLGIATDVLSRIGTPFFTTKGSGRGLGLGVFLARAFCESRGGDLAIESQAGVGTRAVIRLPGEGAS